MTRTAAHYAIVQSECDSIVRVYTQHGCNAVITDRHTSVHEPRLIHVRVDPYLTLNLVSPHDALMHHFTSLKTYLIFLKLRVLERKFP